MEAFALQLLRRFSQGETAQQLSRELAIPVDRIEQRLRAAAHYWELRRGQAEHLGIDRDARMAVAVRSIPSGVLLLRLLADVRASSEPRAPHGSAPKA